MSLSSAACPHGPLCFSAAGRETGGHSTLPAAHRGCCAPQAETADSRLETTVQGFGDE